MPVRLTHIVDEETPEDGARLLSLLLRLLPPSRVTQQVIVAGPMPATLTAPGQVAVHRAGRRLTWPGVSGIELRRALRQAPPDVIFAWSAPVMAALGAAHQDVPAIVAVISEPADALAAGRWWHSLGSGCRPVNVVCTSQTVRRRIVEAGIPIEAGAIIRPGVDFGEIRQAKERISRAEVGLPSTGRVLLTASPPTRIGGQYQAVWAAAVLHQIWPDAHLVVPGRSREQRRLHRLVERIYCPSIFHLTEDRFSPAELLAVSDLLVVPAAGDIPTGWLAWAMAVGVPVVAAAVPSVAELIAHRHNGFLCRSADPHTLALAIREAFESDRDLRRCAETARTEAYDTFRAQRCVDEYLSLLRNVVEVLPPCPPREPRSLPPHKGEKADPAAFVPR